MRISIFIIIQKDVNYLKKILTYINYRYIIKEKTIIGELNDSISFKK
jgi:hypothetical protein